DLTVRYGRTTALDRVSLRFEPGVIYGLLGRNGTGKTSLLSTVAAFRRADGGTLRVDGEDPYENARVMAGMCLIREGGDFGDCKVSQALDHASRVRPHWDAAFAATLMDLFELSPAKKTT